MTEVPVHQPPAHQSQQQSQRLPLHPLNPPASALTSKTRNVPNRGHLKQGTQSSRAKGKAKVLSIGSDSDEQMPAVSTYLNRCSTILLLLSI